MLSTVEIYNKGINLLVENMGIVEAEQFISVIKKENVDYTKWQRDYFDALPEGEFMKGAERYARTHEYGGSGIEI